MQYEFLTSTLSEKRPKSIWHFIHWILLTKNETLTANFDDLNKQFITTANLL